jgi:RND family efflux transporter MFP subunit
MLAAGGLFAASQLLRSEEGPRVARFDPEPLAVTVVPVRLESDFEIAESFTGLAEARRTSQLGFSGGGRVENLAVRVGDRVSAGQNLARLDTRNLNAQLSAARAAVAEAEAAHRLAMSTVERQRTLASQGHVSFQRVDEAEAQASTAAARIDSARAQADTIRVQLDLARITAPYDGVITARMMDEGAIASPGQPVFELVETGALEARIGVPAVTAATLQPGATYELSSATGPVIAELRSVTGVVDMTQRTVNAIFLIPDSEAVPAGSIVRLVRPRQITEDGFWVPLKALSSASRGAWTLYVAVPDGSGGWRAETRTVDALHPAGDRVFVRGPMRPDDRVITEGVHRLSPGLPVIPRDAPRADQSLDR